MGLDMYLYGRKDNYGLTEENIGQIGICVEVGYWRKANQIHNWFVENVQGGVDNCATYFVSKETLSELRDICKTVLENPDQAQELLPTSSGFFFGTTEYDEWYFKDLEDTIKIVDRCLELKYDYYEYQSSW